MDNQGMQKTVFAEMLRKIDLNSFLQCEQLIKPRITDLKLLPKVIEEIFKRIPAENKTLGIAVIYYLYAEYKLHFQKVRMSSGFRILLSNHLGLGHREMVNYHSEPIISFYKNNRYAAKVKALAEEVLLAINANNNLSA